MGDISPFYVNSFVDLMKRLAYQVKRQSSYLSKILSFPGKILESLSMTFTADGKRQTAKITSDFFILFL